MSEKQILVPKGMVKVVLNRFKRDGQHVWRETGTDKQCTLCGAIDCSSAGECECLGIGAHTIGLILDAALRWLSENPISWKEEWTPDVRLITVGACFENGQRRMFLAPEPNTLGEIEDLLTVQSEAEDGITWTNEGHDRAVLEAYRRGKSSGR